MCWDSPTRSSRMLSSSFGGGTVHRHVMFAFAPRMCSFLVIAPKTFSPFGLSTSTPGRSRVRLGIVLITVASGIVAQHLKRLGGSWVTSCVHEFVLLAATLE